MKKRLITAFVLIAILATIIYLNTLNTLALSIFANIVITIATIELCLAFSYRICTANKVVLSLYALCSFII